MASKMTGRERLIRGRSYFVSLRGVVPVEETDPEAVEKAAVKVEKAKEREEVRAQKTERDDILSELAKIKLRMKG